MSAATRNIQIEQAVATAVSLVNARPGQACVRLRFRSDDTAEFDFVANAASLKGDRFCFQAGFETFDGTIGELADIRTEMIRQ